VRRGPFWLWVIALFQIELRGLAGELRLGRCSTASNTAGRCRAATKSFADIIKRIRVGRATISSLTRELELSGAWTPSSTNSKYRLPSWLSTAGLGVAILNSAGEHYGGAFFSIGSTDGNHRRCRPQSSSSLGSCSGSSRRAAGLVARILSRFVTMPFKPDLQAWWNTSGPSSSPMCSFYRKPDAALASTLARSKRGTSPSSHSRLPTVWNSWLRKLVCNCLPLPRAMMMISSISSMDSHERKPTGGLILLLRRFRWLPSLLFDPTLPRSGDQKSPERLK